MLFRRKPMDRAALVAAGDRARSRGRVKKAIGLYRKALAEAPNDAMVHGKLAPLLARRRQKAEALASFTKAAAEQARAGFTDRAIALQKQAVTHYPEEPALWDELVRLHLVRNRRPDAAAALVAGGRRLRRRRDALLAERLLKRALDLDPWNPAAVDLLARTLARAGKRGEALEVLEAFGAIARGLSLRRARRLAFRLSPTPRNLWRWIQATWNGR